MQPGARYPSLVGRIQSLLRRMLSFWYALLCHDSGPVCHGPGPAAAGLVPVRAGASRWSTLRRSAAVPTSRAPSRLLHLGSALPSPVPATARTIRLARIYTIRLARIYLTATLVPGQGSIWSASGQRLVSVRPAARSRQMRQRVLERAVSLGFVGAGAGLAGCRSMVLQPRPCVRFLGVCLACGRLLRSGRPVRAYCLVICQHPD